MNPNFLFYLPPIGDDKAPTVRKVINFSGTGTAESSNSSARFIPGKKYILAVGAVPILVVFSNELNAPNKVDSSNGMILPAGFTFCFECIDNPKEGWGSKIAYVEALDGVSAYTASAICVN